MTETLPEADKTYMLREYTSQESKIAHLMHLPPSFMEPSEVAQYLLIKEAVCEKLVFPERTDHTPHSPKNAPVEQNVTYHMLTVESDGDLGYVDGAISVMRINCLVQV